MVDARDKRLIDRDVRKGRRTADADVASLVDLSEHTRSVAAEEADQLATELVQKSEARRERIERQLAEEPAPRVAPRAPAAPLSPADI